MPRLEPKIVQRELEQGWIWPVYWLYGEERMKSRELLKRIRKTVLGESGGMLGLSEETLDGGETEAARVVEAAQSLSLGGGIRFLVIRDAQAIKNADEMACLLGPKAKKEDLTAVCVFLARDLDGRKKFSKQLLEQAAVVACEEVPEADREAWIDYLAKRRGLALDPEWVVQLASLDPWTLDSVDQELEKYSLAIGTGVEGEVFQGGGVAGLGGGAPAFMEAFFKRDLREVLLRIEEFADRPDESLPLLGLLGWNVRHLALMMVEKQKGSRTLKLNPMVAERLSSWAARWTIEEMLELQSALTELDFQLKQTPLVSLGTWSELAQRFCRA